MLCLYVWSAMQQIYRIFLNLLAARFNKTEISEAWLELSSHTHEHISLIESFYDSYLAQFPRRSIEGYIKSNIEGWWGDPTISFTRASPH